MESRLPLHKLPSESLTETWSASWNSVVGISPPTTDVGASWRRKSHEVSIGLFSSGCSPTFFLVIALFPTPGDNKRQTGVGSGGHCEEDQAREGGALWPREKNCASRRGLLRRRLGKEENTGKDTRGGCRVGNILLCRGPIMVVRLPSVRRAAYTPRASHRIVSSTTMGTSSSSMAALTLRPRRRPIVVPHMGPALCGKLAYILSRLQF